MTNLKIDCEHNALHKVASEILKLHGDGLQDAGRSDDVIFLNMLVRRHIVWGTPRYEARLKEVVEYLNGFNIDIYKIGDMVRYSEGSTALMMIESVHPDYAGPGKHRYYGIQCYGGPMGAYHDQLSLASGADKNTWDRHNDSTGCIKSNRN
jgi:hypothetical protein